MSVLLSPPPSAFQLFFTALTGVVGGKEGKGLLLLSALGSSQVQICPPCHQLWGVPKSPVLDPAPNRKIPRMMLQTQAQCLWIPRTVLRNKL